MRRLLSFAAALFFLSFSSLFAQRPNFKHLTVDHGLSQNSVLTICQDSLGYLWFGTQNGLNRYDGTKIEIFESNESDTSSLSSSFVNTLCVEDKTKLWVGTKRGLSLWNQQTGRFQRMDKFFVEDTLNGHYDFWDIIKDSRGAIWLLGEAKGFHIFRKEKGDDFFHQVLTLPQPTDNTLLELYGQLAEDHFGDVWIGTSKCGLWRYAAREKTFAKIFLEGSTDLPITSIAEDAQRTLWIGTLKSGLFQYQRPLQRFVPVGGTNDIAIRSLYLGKDGEFWVGTDKGGLNQYHPKTKSFSFYDQNIEDAGSLLHNSVWSIFQDRQDILWVGTYAGGVSYYDPRVGNFKSFRAGNGTASLSNNTVAAFAEDERGNFWVATDRGGLNYFDPATRTFQKFRHRENNPHGLSSDILVHVRYTSQHQLWIGTWLSGLQYFDEKTKLFHTYRANKNDSASISSNTVTYILEDKKKNLWLATTYGLDFIANENVLHSPLPRVKAKHFLHDPAEIASLSNHYLNFVFEDRQSNLWVGTQEGLNRLDKTTGKFTHYLHNPNHENIFTNAYINSMTETKDGNFLLGSLEHGLLFYDKRNNTLTSFNTRNGFPVNTVYGILDDGRGFFWISTNKGLLKFSLDTRSVIRYTHADGLQGNEFKGNAYLRSKAGQMLFGGTNGFTLFSPDSVKASDQAVPLIITKFKLFNETVTPGPNSPIQEDISLLRDITLNHEQNFLGFEFAAIDFSSPENKQYAYMLEGLDKDWNYVGNHRTANYPSVPPGDYVFKIMVANAGNSWGTPLLLAIHIEPPWWNTIWFRILAVIGCMTGIWSYVRVRTNQLIQRKKLLEQAIKERTGQLQRSNQELSQRQEEILLQKEEIGAQRDNLHQQYQTIQSLSEIGQRITASIKKEELIPQVYAVVNRLMDASHLSIGYFDPQKNVIEFTTLRGGGTTLDETTVPLSEERISVWCLTQRQSLLSNDLPADAHRILGEGLKRYAGKDAFGSAIYLPIRSTVSDTTDMLVVKSYVKNAYSEVNLNTLKSLVAYIAIAFDNARAYKALEAQSNTLEKQSVALRDLDRLKTKFFLNISHEFRTPLTLIVSPLESILHSKIVDKDVMLRRKLEMMNKNAKQLQQLINEMLDLRNFELGAAESVIKKQDGLVSFLSNILARFEPLAQQHQITMRLIHEEPEILIWFDKTMLEKVFANLYMNALKYTNVGGSVDTNLVVIRSKNIVEVRITDTGIGIEEKDLPYIFERFYQGVQPVNAIHGSTGIGLSLVKDLVAFHAGDIIAESRVGKGTSFAVRLPYQNNSDKGNESASSPNDYQNSFEEISIFTDETKDSNSKISTISDKATLLLVEDNPDLREFLRLELQFEFDCLEASNGSDGLLLAQQAIPDLIISDIMMPVMDGIHLCQQVKADLRTSHIPFILLTAKSGEKSHIDGLEIGADDFVAKPFNIKILLARVRNLIATRKKLHALFSSKEEVDASIFIENRVDRAFVERIDTLITDKLKDTALTHELIAREIGMSKTQLYRKLKAITGNTVHEYIRNIRLKRAHNLIRTKPELRVSEISYDVGFIDHSYFAKCFHNFYGVWPKDLRQAGEQ